MNDAIDSARSLVVEDQLEKAIEVLQGFVGGMIQSVGSGDRSLRDLRSGLSVRMNGLYRLERDRKQRKIRSDDFEHRRERLVFELMEMMDEIEDVAKRTEAPLPLSRKAAAFDAPSESKLEKIWGRNTLQNLAWLEIGLKAARSVCRVVNKSAVGSGFQVGNGYVITNNHVVPNIETARETFLEFNFEEDVDNRLREISRYQLEPDEFFHTDIDLDCTVVKIATSESEVEFDSWGSLEIGDGSGGIEIGAHVTIVQHPSGGPKKISFTENEIVNVFDHRLQYMTDTLPGSSGSPVFDDTWRVIALHHAGGELLKDNSGASHFANEGILMSNILAVPEFKMALTS